MTETPASATVLQELELRLRKLEDSTAIAELLNRYVKAVDACRWTEWEQCFAEDGRAEFPFGDYAGRRGMGAWCAKNLVGFKGFEHLFGNLEINLDGDRATVRNNAWIACVMDLSRPHEHFDNGGSYDWELGRSAEGWRIKRVQLKVVWLSREASKADPYSRIAPR